MCQVFPHNGLLAEHLKFISDGGNGNGGGGTDFCGPLWIITNVRPNTFDANSRTIEGPQVHVTVTTRSERFGTDVQKVRRKRVRRWENPPGAGYASELT